MQIKQRLTIHHFHPATGIRRLVDRLHHAEIDKPFFTGDVVGEGFAFQDQLSDAIQLCRLLVDIGEMQVALSRPASEWSIADRGSEFKKAIVRYRADAVDAIAI